MAIYTKTGDKGTTSLFSGSRVKKYELRVETYGTFDELNAQISLAEKYVTSEENKTCLKNIQRLLFYFCAELSTEEVDLTDNTLRITTENIETLEKMIDKWTEALPKAKQFILPGKSVPAAHLHVARAVARRAERLLVRLAEEVEIRQELSKYVNRLSDFLYAMAREEDYRYQVEKLTEEVVSRYGASTGVGGTYMGERLTLADCTKLAEAAEIAANNLGVPITMAIADKEGHLLYHYRMKDALLVSIEIAKKKAYSVIAMGAATHELSELTQPGASLYQIETSTNGDLVTFGGGLPIVDKNGKIVGSIGISGGTVEEDIIIAKSALERVGV